VFFLGAALNEEGDESIQISSKKDSFEALSLILGVLRGELLLSNAVDCAFEPDRSGLPHSRTRP
jgi:hypothetical protein